MDVLIFLVFVFLLLALVGGYFSFQHAVLKPVADWMYPQQPAPAATTTGADAQGTHALHTVALLLLAFLLVGGMLMAVMWAVGWV